MAKAKEYRNYIDFAFFAVNFGYSKSEYEELTPTEIAFIYKAWEDKTVRESNLLNQSVYNALVNSNRKKNKSYQPLWKKKGNIDIDLAKDNEKLIRDIEKRDGKDWVKKIYQKR